MKSLALGRIVNDYVRQIDQAIAKLTRLLVSAQQNDLFVQLEGNVASLLETVWVQQVFFREIFNDIKGKEKFNVPDNAFFKLEEWRGEQRDWQGKERQSGHMTQ